MRPHIRPSRCISPLCAVLALAILAIGPILTGCAEEAPETAGETAPAAPGTAEPAAGEVTYEPAYPEEVSEEGLSETDTLQQDEHGHEHAEGSHAHGEDEHHEHEHGTAEPPEEADGH